MNIFYVNRDPVRAAKDLPDKLIVKMPLESAQLLCTAINLAGGTSQYKTTHQNHPSAIWARECKENFFWLVIHGLGLCQTYTDVYDKKHKCQDIIEACIKSIDLMPDGKGPFHTEPPQCMPEQYRGNDTVEAYRKYMVAEKTRYAKWKNREKPEWWK
jgi:hypothetical protein